MRGPEPRPLLDELQNVLVVYALVFLGVVAFLRLRGMESGVGVRAVFREADDAIRVQGVVFVKELLVLRKLSQIPAEIEIIAGNVRDRDQRAVLFQHKGVGHDRGAGGIQLVAELV